MTEEASTTTQVAATEASEQDAQTQTKPTETVEFWKQRAREQEKRAKDNADAAKRLQEFEDRDKTESQRLGEAADAFQKRAVDAESRAMRLEIAAEKGLTPAQAKRLVGDSREELESDADDLLENFKPSGAEPASAVSVDLDLGTRGSTTTSSASGDPAADFAAFMKRL